MQKVKLSVLSEKMRKIAERLQKDAGIICEFYKEALNPQERKFRTERIRASKNGVELIIECGLDIKEIFLSGKLFSKSKEDLPEAIKKLKAA